MIALLKKTTQLPWYCRGNENSTAFNGFTSTECLSRKRRARSKNERGESTLSYKQRRIFCVCATI